MNCDMELDYITGDILEEGEEEEVAEVGVSNDDVSKIEGERCGICMDIILERGVLDCCEHRFCFECIENWATITNLCPLCQNDFQSIACIPVYDTDESSMLDEDSLSRDEGGDDDTWGIDANSSSHSTPSFYIDENEVICFDGDCKIRNGSTKNEEDSSLDTSIACDSCDIWYHAFCVGFDAEAASEDTWLCPRCLANETPNEIDFLSMERANKQRSPENGNSDFSVGNEFAGKVSISVADDGETAVVVSMVGGNNWAAEPNENNLSAVKVLENPYPSTSYIDIPHSRRNNIQPVSASSTVPSAVTEFRSIKIEETRNQTSCSDCVRNSGMFTGSSAGKISIESETRMSHHLGLSVESFQTVDNIKTNSTMDIVSKDHPPKRPEECSPKVDNISNDGTMDRVTKDLLSKRSEEFLPKAVKNVINADVVIPTGQKRKDIDCSDVRTSGNEDEIKALHENLPFAKKPRDDGKTEMMFSEFTKQHVKKEDDIMDFVKGFGLKPSSRQNTADKSSKEEENGAGLRVKKIMRRSTKDEELSVVEKIRKEIREAVRNKSAKSIGENVFDPKLLAAFRAAIGPKPEPPKNLTPVALKARKLMLQKGRIRENLTKKIYSDLNGRRKRAWNRDCEVEFWKHRCMRATKPEKIETLKSVLTLLKTNSKGSEDKAVSECQTSNPILSRLYLADKSVFPRKDDIKPLSDLKATGNSEQIKEQHFLAENNSNPTLAIKELKVAETKINVSRVGNAKGTNSTTTGSKTAIKLDDPKKDKRQWALEVLARKKSLAGNSVTQDKQEASALLEGNYPLLAQLPADMIPVLALSQHNKIPVSVRQKQLYRLTEHFLRKANLPIIRRTAATELAVADATNIEKEVVDKSNSKVVYLNLCSQQILHLSTKSRESGTTESNSLLHSEKSEDKLKQNHDECTTDPMILEALRTAGLLSDSLPNSPDHVTKVPHEVDNVSLEAREEGHDTLFETDKSHAEGDIDCDSKYKLDEDCIRASALEAPKLEQEKVESKVEVSFFTLESLKDPKTPSKVEVSENSSCLLKCLTDTEIILEEVSQPPDKGCEESYGHDQGPLVKEFPVNVCQKLQGLVDTKSKVENHVLDSDDSCVPNKSIQTLELGSESGVDSTSVSKSVGNTAAEETVAKQKQIREGIQGKEKKTKVDLDKNGIDIHSVSKKVEAYIKEHIRPLWKSGVITAEEYRWALSKTTDKVMKYHPNSKNANFLIKEGEKVKKLAEQYIEAAQQKEKGDGL